MNARELILLSPYRLPGMSPMTLADEDMIAWMNAWSVLWHPALLWGAAAPPRVDSAYDYEQPQSHHVYALPETPEQIMPEDWEQRIAAAGAILLKVGTDRQAALARIAECGVRSADSSSPPPESKAEHQPTENSANAANDVSEEDSSLQPLLNLTPEQIHPFLAIGLGYLLQATLSEAMEHENLLDTGAFWEDVQQAIATLAGFPEAGAQDTDLPLTGTAGGDFTANPESSGDPEWQPGDAPPPPPADFEEFSPPSAAAEDNFPTDDPTTRSEYQNYPYDAPGTSEGASPTPGAEFTEAWLRHLQGAAGRLLSAREVLYPVTIYLLDLWLLDENRLPGPWPATVARDFPANVVACSNLLERWQREQPEQFALVKERVERERLEICGGTFVEREDALLPVESQLWNFRKGQEAARTLLGKKIDIFARQRFGVHPQIPLFLTGNGLPRALHLVFDDSALPTYNATTISWPSPDGKQVDAFVRKPLAVDRAETLFNLCHSLFRTIREDHSATLAFQQGGKPVLPWYEDLVELSRFGPVLGDWVTLNRYFNEVMPGEYAQAPSMDEFHFDYLSERCQTDPMAAYGGEAVQGENQEAEPAGPQASPSPPAPLPQEARGAEGASPSPSTPAVSDRPAGAIFPPQTSLASQKTMAQTIPVSGFARHLRWRRHIDTAWTLLAIYRGLTGKLDLAEVEKRLTEVEDKIESQAPDIALEGNEAITELEEIERRVLGALAERLQARASNNEPGYLILNPCSFARRLALELEGALQPLPIKDHVKACQLDGDRLKAVVEVPALGFCWIPRSGPAGTPPMPMKMRLADERTVRNDFLEAEIDPQTGGLRGVRDRRTGVSRLAQRLVFAPGSQMQATKIEVTSTGPTLGELVSEGILIGEQQQVLARFRQRFRAWLGRPVLEMRIELDPVQPPAGYPWHAYFGARFAWRDERTILLRGVNGTSYISSHPRPQTPDFIELRAHRQSTIIFPNGLPFLQRQETRMIDVILIPQGETCRTFDLTLALDREYPMQTALGLATPVPLIATSKGPPPVGATGWLFHLDSPQLLLTGMRPGPQEWRDPQAAETPASDAITVRLLEVAAQSGLAEFRCARDPRRATLLNAGGERLLELMTSGDAVQLEITPGDFVQVQVEFGE